MEHLLRMSIGQQCGFVIKDRNLLIKREENGIHLKVDDGDWMDMNVGEGVSYPKEESNIKGLIGKIAFMDCIIYVAEL